MPKQWSPFACVLTAVTIGAVLQAVWAVLLAQYHQTSDVVYGLTVSGRPPDMPGALHTVGCFINTVPIRVTVRPDDTLATVAAMLEAWSDLMGATPLSTMLGFMGAVGGFNVAGDLPRIACPVLAMTSDSKLHPVAEAETWRKQIRQSELAVIPGDGFHAAAVYPDECARAALAFIAKHSTQEH